MSGRWSYAIVVTLLLAAQENVRAQDAAIKPLLEQVPADAAVVVVIPNVERLADDATLFGQMCGIEDARVDADELFREVRTTTQPFDADVLDRSGPVVLVFDPDSATVATLARARSGETTAENPAVRVHDGVVLIAADTEMVKRFPQSGGQFPSVLEKAGGSLGEELDALLYLDVGALQDTIAQGMQMARGLVAMLGAAPEARFAVPMVRWMLDEVQALVEQSRTVVVEARISAERLSVRKTVGLDPQSGLAGYLARIRKTDKDLLRGVSGENPSMVYAGEWQSPPDVPTLSERMSRMMIDSLSDESLDKERLLRAVQVYRKIEGWSGTFGVSESGRVLIQGIGRTSTPTQVVDEMAEASALSGGFISAMGMGLSMDMQRSSETIAGRNVDVLTAKVQAEDPQMQQMLDQMYGENFCTYIFAVEDGVYTVAGDESVARPVAERVISGEVGAPLSENERVRAALETLSPDPQGFVLIDYAGMLGSLFGSMQIPDMPPLRPPARPTPYLACGLYLGEQSFTFELHAPSPSVRAIVDMFKNAGPQ